MKDNKDIKIPLSEIKEVFELLEEVQDLFHQPMKYKDEKVTEKFANENYNKIKKLYYETVWNWLPKEEQEHYENR